MKQPILFIITMFIFLSCGRTTTTNQQKEEFADDVTQVLYFHTKKRCITCNAIEKLSQEVVDSLANEKVVMQIIDISKDQEMADKYEVVWSSLLLERDGEIKNITDVGFSYAKNQPQEFKAKLVEAIQSFEK